MGEPELIARPRKTAGAPYLSGVRLVRERAGRAQAYPFDLAFVQELDLCLRSAVTFFVGENGTGKSTLMEAIAELCGLPVSGGGRNEVAATHGPDLRSPLAFALRPSFRHRPPDAYFLRAELQAHFASLLDARAADPEFTRDPYGRFGGRSLHTRSHGEAFLAILQHRMKAGLFLLDEPESALSPQRQLALLLQMFDLVSVGRSQFIIATHSPILLTYPEADIISFDGPSLCRVSLEETSQYQITRGILHSPQLYWKHLTADDAERGDAAHPADAPAGDTAHPADAPAGDTAHPADAPAGGLGHDFG